MNKIRLKTLTPQPGNISKFNKIIFENKTNIFDQTDEQL